MSKTSEKPPAARATRCPTCGRKHRRSNPANSRYWLLLHAMAEKLKPGGVAYSAEQWHLYCKSRWIGCQDMKLPNGKVIPVPASSADLDTPTFNEYMTAIEAWAAERDVFLGDMEGT